MTTTSERKNELMELASAWMAQGMSPSDVVSVLVDVTNLVIDRNNLEYAYLTPEMK